MRGEFDRLHPSLQHHIVNTMQWPGLRPLQHDAIAPVLAGEHGIFLAPTAGGKTEAAVFPLFTRMVTEQWRPLSVLYLAPLRALLNNLVPRLELYGGFVGRRVGLWHGDTGQGQRARMMAEPPDLLLTTPESLEAMLISRRVNEQWLFPNLQAVIVDEVHAFAASDRGWHLLAVLERLSRLAGRDLQRIGLSATVGNPDELLGWLRGSSRSPGRVVNPAAAALAEPDVTLDHVGSLDNAATVIDRLHRGEKRLVFVDSRRRVEELAVALRAKGTTTFVSHGSLGQQERRRAEQAFAEATNCVIVATSTLELGIDVGDLDRVIQIDAPSTVAGFLQRIGRTGRRPGSSRNALLLATSEQALLTGAGLLRLWGSGYVEPAEPPPLPAHLLVQQLLALTLQEANEGLGRATWQQWLGQPPVFDADTMARADGLADHLLANDWLHDDGGLLSPGTKAEQTIGRRHFLELTSAFVADPLIRIRHGRTEIGQVPDLAIMTALGNRPGPPAILLAGRSWTLGPIDWKRRIAQVEPDEHAGSVRYPGGAVPLSYELCQSMAAVLAGDTPGPVVTTRRADAALAGLRAELPLARPGRTMLVPRAGDSQRWYTFAGLRANLELAARLAPLRSQISQKDNLYITIDAGITPDRIRAALSADTDHYELGRLVTAVSGALKLRKTLPDTVVDEILIRRFRDPAGVQAVAKAMGIDEMPSDGRPPPQHVPSRRPEAKADRSSWQNAPPSGVVPIDYNDTLTVPEFERLSAGFVPKVMEDKWFAFVEGTTLHLHRSWTGMHVFTVELTPDNDGYTIAGAWKNQELEPSASDAGTLRSLVHGLLLRRPQAGR